jgi:tetratricopeptide (TPR) repeat protein
VRRTSSLTCAVLTLLGAATALMPAFCRAQPPKSHLEAAQIFYDEQRFDDCLRQLELAAGAPSSPREVADIELYRGLCKHNLHRFAEAEEHFVIALRLNPEVKLPPFTSPKIGASFQRAQQKIAELPALLPAPAVRPVPEAEELVPATEASPSPADAVEAPRSRRLLVPAVFGGIAVGASATGAYFGTRSREFEARANASDSQREFNQQAQQARSSATAANVAFAAAGAAAVAAVLTYLIQ